MSLPRLKHWREAYIRGNTAGWYQDWSAAEVVAFGGLGVYLPQDEIKIESSISMGATHAPSSWGNAHRWSAPREAFQNGCAERIQSSVER
eukprot:scaffold3391_cov129-Isochrysis_galbana.AAC.1